MLVPTYFIFISSLRLLPTFSKKEKANVCPPHKLYHNSLLRKRLREGLPFAWEVKSLVPHPSLFRLRRY